MYSKEITVVNATGLHARPASDFVTLAGKFKSSIYIQRSGEDRKYNGKSMVMLMTLGLAQGESATLYAEGADEKEAVDALADLVANTKD
jgi:phosphocarrier protein HPr